MLETSKKFPETFAQRDFILKETSGQNFYNTSEYDFKKLLDDPTNIEINFYNYINGYSKEATDIIENFELKRHIEKMVQFAKNNNPEEFKKVYYDEFKKKAFRRYQQNTEMFEKMMSEEGYMEDFMKSMFKYIYESLKNKG